MTSFFPREIVLKDIYTWFVESSNPAHSGIRRIEDVYLHIENFLIRF